MVDGERSKPQESTPLLGGQARSQRRRQNNKKGKDGSWGFSLYGQEEGKTELDWRQEQRRFFLLMASFAFAGMVFAVVENEILWYSNVGMHTEETVFTHGLKFGVVLSTIAAIICLVYYYDAQIKVLRASGVEFSPGFGVISLKESRLLTWFCIDLVVLIPQPMPFIHFTFAQMDVAGASMTVYSADTIFMCCMFARLLFLPRFVAEVSLFKQDLAFRMARFYNVDINTWVIMRSLLSADLNTLLFFIVVATFAISYTLLLVERPHIQASGDVGHGLDEFETCVWLTIITLTTVGLGDVVPATKLGRVTVVIASCAAIAFYALIVNIIVANVQLSPQEARIVEFVKRSGLQKTAKEHAAKVLQACWRQYKLNVRALAAGRVNTVLKNHPTIMNAIVRFRYHHRKVKGLQLDRDTQLSRSVYDLQATAAGMQRMLTEMHDKVVGGGGGASRGKGRADKKEKGQ